MKLAGVFRKALREASRDRLVVALTLAFAPFFVVLEWFAFPSLTPAYKIGFVDQDPGNAGEELAAEIGGIKDGSGRSVLDVVRFSDRDEATERLKRREVTALVVVPEDFSAALARRREEPAAPPATLTLSGDLTQASYAVAAVMAGSALEAYVQRATGRASPVKVLEEALGGTASRTDFELYVPGVFVFAVIMLVFQAAMAVAREAEAGTLRRLQLTRMTSFDYLGGTSAVLLLIALGSVALTFATARLLGFRSNGPLWLAMGITAVTAASVIGTGLMVAAFSRTTSQAFVLANFPMGLLMFFSGAMFPMPKLALLEVGGHALGPFELLPPTHAVAALNKIFALGAGPAEVAFELGALVSLSALYFAAGVVLLRRRWQGG
ncbi:MAG: ABC transporter permease [Deltaproteobacteria bacterium]|nr:ABC transporter permease [Deltaproteobacteria bacterium]